MVIAIGLHLLHSKYQILASRGLADQQNSAATMKQPNARTDSAKRHSTLEPTILHIYFSCLDMSVLLMQQILTTM